MTSSARLVDTPSTGACKPAALECSTIIGADRRRSRSPSPSIPASSWKSTVPNETGAHETPRPRRARAGRGRRAPSRPVRDSGTSAATHSRRNPRPPRSLGSISPASPGRPVNAQHVVGMPFGPQAVDRAPRSARASSAASASWMMSRAAVFAIGQHRVLQIDRPPCQRRSPPPFRNARHGRRGRTGC